MKRTSICAALKLPALHASAIATMALGLSGCATVTGTYVVTATDSAGQPVAPGRRMIAEGSKVYTVRNGICISYPKSLVVIRDLKTGEELKGQSPYQCP